MEVDDDESIALAWEVGRSGASPASAPAAVARHSISRTVGRLNWLIDISTVYADRTVHARHTHGDIQRSFLSNHSAGTLGSLANESSLAINQSAKPRSSSSGEARLISIAREQHH